MLNLYVNAWQAMPGGGDLYIETEHAFLTEIDVKPYQSEPGKYVKISVTDTGTGMDEATQQRIFDPFFTTKEMGRGTGLGLATVYGIIKNHDGFITVYSVKGKGSTFTIYLPASSKKVEMEKALSEEIVRGRETVLLVDDEKIILEVGEEMLRSLGYKVFKAMSGNDAIEVYRKNQDAIDVVILDMIMPNRGGDDTYGDLKMMNPDIKVLLSSGYSITGQASEIMNRGCNGFIQKPFTIKKLSKKLREILDTDDRA
jgi:two-component system, cell cycle sensor histidine kinase and response regulator CckA